MLRALPERAIAELLLGVQACLGEGRRIMATDLRAVVDHLREHQGGAVADLDTAGLPPAVRHLVHFTADRARFTCSQTFWECDDDSVSTTVCEQAVLSHLVEQTAADQPCRLGHLDTGSHDVVLHNAPRVTLYAGWPLCAGRGRTHARRYLGNRSPALTARHRPGPHLRARSVLAPLGAVGRNLDLRRGPRRLSDALAEEILVQSSSVQLDEDATPPGHNCI